MFTDRSTDRSIGVSSKVFNASRFSQLLSYKSSVSLVGDSSSASDSEVEDDAGTTFRNWNREDDVKKTSDGETVKLGTKLHPIPEPTEAQTTSARAAKYRNKVVEGRSNKITDMYLDVETKKKQSIPSIRSSMFRRRSSGSKTIVHKDDLDKYKNIILFKILKHCEDYKERITEHVRMGFHSSFIRIPCRYILPAACCLFNNLAEYDIICSVTV